MKIIYNILTLLFCCTVLAQEAEKTVYRKRVLESTELEILGSYYTQDGKNAAVTGGIGTEEISNTAADIVVSIPLNIDDVLTITAGISAYTSASSSNLNPFDGAQEADPFVASSGASKGDSLLQLSANYSHSSADRNTVWSVHASAATEHDYSSLGFGGSLIKLFNEKNTEVSISFSAYLDNWIYLYPYELGGPGGDPEEGYVPPFDINNFTVTGNPNYTPIFTPYDKTNRNTYSLGLGFSQILSKKAQASIVVDVTQQNGQLANHMQRMYFSDIDDTFIENFHLADDVERLPGKRFKTAIGGRFNYYLNEQFTIRTFYRYYFDDWGINSHTASVEIPYKINDKWTLYPSYRFYNQSASKYFAPYETHLSTSTYYTSDYDLSKFTANQFGFGVSYTNPFARFKIGRMRFKSFDIRYDMYKRNTGLKAGIFSGGIKFTFD